VALELPDALLIGELGIPDGASGLVLFVHGSGSSRRSPRNRFVATALQAHGLATLLFDLLTPEEEAADALSAALRFDIDLLAHRVAGATAWLKTHPALATYRIGLFGASTGAAAALKAAAAAPASVGAVVSRGGRPDLAGEALGAVCVPTLLIVGARDSEVLQLNRRALARLSCEKQLSVVAGATHLFEEPGTLAQAAELAAAWFTRHLPAQAEAARP
jgi:putative phosphoribosyl transferase